MAFGMLWRPGRFSDDVDVHPGIRAKGLDLVKECFGRIEDRLRGRTWAVGEAPTLADFYLMIFWYWGQEEVGIDMAQEYPSYSGVVSRLRLLPGVQAAIEEEGL